MKTSRIIPSLTFLTALLITLISTASTSAHGPEDYLSDCTVENLDASWQANPGLCDPNNPPDISQGIAISDDQGTPNIFPDGLCYPSFNNFIDMIDLDFPYGPGVEVGMDPYYSNNPPLFKDERNFFKARLRDETADWSDYKDDITMDVGDKVTFMVYMHNNGDPCFNDNVQLNIPSDRIYKNWNTTSHGTKVNVLPGFSMNSEGKLSKIISAATQFKASIWSQDARNAQGDIAPIENGVTIRPADGKTIELEYSQATAFYTDYTHSWNKNEHPINPATLLSQNGFSVSTLLDNGNIKGSAGDFYACEPYIAVIVFTVEAKEVPITPNVCKDLQATSSEMNLNGEKVLNLQINAIDFSPQNTLPAGTMALWTSTDETGEFWDTKTGQYIQGGSFQTDDPYQMVYYYGGSEGNARITVKLTGIPDSLANSDNCSQEFEYIAPAPVCQYITTQIEAADYNKGSFDHGYRLYINKAAFSDEVIPPGTLVKWTASNQTGEFYNQVGELYTPYSTTPKDYTYTELSTNPSNPILSEVYYRGDDPVDITAQIITPSQLGIDTQACVAVVPIRPAVEQNYCLDLQATEFDPEKTLDINGETAYELQVTDLTFSGNGQTPEGLRGFWVSLDDENGRFYNGNKQLVGIGHAFTDNLFEKVYYIGTGRIRVTLLGLPDAIANPTVCSAFTEIIEKAPVCTDIKVDHPEEIEVGTLSTFRAKSYDANGELYGTAITYWVEPGYGKFYLATAKPDNIPANDSPMVYEATSDLFTIPVTPTGAISLNTINSQMAIDFSFAVSTGNLWNYNSAASDAIVVPYSGNFEILPSTRSSSYNQSKFYGLAQVFNFDVTNQSELNNIDSETLYSAIHEVITVNQGATVYFEALKAGENVIHVQAAGTDVPNVCKRDFSIIPKRERPLICTDINASVKRYGTVSKEIRNLSPNTIYELSAIATYSKEFEEGTITYTIDPHYGIFIKVPAPKLQRAIFLNALYALSGGNLTEESARTLVNELAQRTGLPLSDIASSTVTTEDSAITYLIVYTVTADKDNILTIRATGTKEPVCTVKYNLVVSPCESIVVKTNPSPFDPETETLIWVTEGDFGDFDGTFLFQAKNPDGSVADGKFRTPTARNIGENPLAVTIDQAGTGIIYDGGQAGDTVTLTAVGALSGTNCNYLLTSTPGEEVKCVDLEIVQPEGQWNTEDFTASDEQKFKIEVETDPAGFASNLDYRWEVSPESAGDWDIATTNSDNSNNPLINYLRNIVVDTLDSAKVSAVGFEDVCSDHINFVPEEEREEIPDIEKLIYYTEKDRWATTINLGGKDSDGHLDDDYQYVTYLAIYDTGSEESVEIWEKEMDNGHIEASNTQDGSFDYLGMAIGVKDKDGNTYIVYKSNDSDEFDEDWYNNEDINGEQLSDFDNYNEDLDFFEDEFECRNDSEDFCITNDFDNLENDFQDGEKIEFKNLDEVDEIYIVYQMENNTAIDDDYCERMIEEFGECGEEFENRIEFEADMGDDEIETGHDDTLAIVICPFILTREGGDTFFHSAIETGIDVSACYDVPSTPVVITPPPETPGTAPSTGQGEQAAGQYLQLPTHDICKFSNDENTTIEEYKNVLKNFSSAVCEMRAEVAEIWKEKYINDAIKANIEKISRFDAVKGSKTISNMNTVATQLGENKNGVFVIEGDLTINGLNVGPSGNIPAGQTYIVKNGTLTINGNITYDDSRVNVANPKSLPSAAFVVIDGNIEISNSVTKIDGILMAVDTESKKDGEIRSKEDKPTYENLLTIRGSMIGDVSNLFFNRRKIGDPLKDEGSVTIRYDERILLNTPPGLTDLIDVSQLKIAE
ncbi:MAG: hypothetical protein ABIH78_02480 [Candidatus Peregrinibacteria bacterium]